MIYLILELFAHQEQRYSKRNTEKLISSETSIAVAIIIIIC